MKEEIKVEDKDVSNASPVPDSLSAGPDATHTSPVSKQDRKNSNPKGMYMKFVSDY